MIPPLRIVQAKATRRYLKLLMRKTGGNVPEVARLAGVNRTAVHQLLDRHGVERVRRKKAAWDREIDPAMPSTGTAWRWTKNLPSKQSARRQ